MDDLRNAEWTKSSRSSPQADNCVEVALKLPGGVVAVRDSKNPEGGAIVMSAARWRKFTTRAR